MEEDDDGHPPKCFGELAFLIFFKYFEGGAP
jgi:hypothetical protein